MGSLAPITTGRALVPDHSCFTKATVYISFPCILQVFASPFESRDTA